MFLFFSTFSLLFYDFFYDGFHALSLFTGRMLLAYNFFYGWATAVYGIFHRSYRSPEEVTRAILHNVLYYIHYYCTNQTKFLIPYNQGIGTSGAVFEQARIQFTCTISFSLYILVDQGHDRCRYLPYNYYVLVGQSTHARYNGRYW